MEIAALLIVALLCFVFAKRDDEKLDNARSQAEAVTYGCGAMGFTLLMGIAGFGALLLFLGQFGHLLLPPAG